MKILDQFDIIPNDNHLFEMAFTHTSYANEHGVESYERLEYLGDAILEFIMSDYLFKFTNYKEGDMTKTRAHYVCENALYEYSLSVGLNEYLRLGKGEEENGGKYRKAIVADIYESFIGALYLDQGLDRAKNFIYATAIPFIEKHCMSDFADYKSELQEKVQTDKRSLVYEVVNEEGPAHDKTFTVVVKIDDIIYGKGVAKSKKDAEQEAAKDALMRSVSK